MKKDKKIRLGIEHEIDIETLAYDIISGRSHSESLAIAVEVVATLDGEIGGSAGSDEFHRLVVEKLFGKGSVVLSKSEVQQKDREIQKLTKLNAKLMKSTKSATKKSKGEQEISSED